MLIKKIALERMATNLTERRFSPCPEVIMRIYDVQAYIVPFVSIASCIVLIFIVLRYSPRDMGALMW